MRPRALQVIPILRIFSIEKAREFYLDYAAFHLDWEHRFEPTGLVLQLSEHYGDGSPGTHFKVTFEGVRELHAELSAKNYPYWRPGITETFWWTDQLNLLVPFGNRISLCEPKPGGTAN